MDAWSDEFFVCGFVIAIPRQGCAILHGSAVMPHGSSAILHSYCAILQSGSAILHESPAITRMDIEAFNLLNFLSSQFLSFTLDPTKTFN
jgi:hypothetical protein